MVKRDMNIERFNQFLGKQNIKVTRTEIQEVFPDVKDQKHVKQMVNMTQNHEIN